MVQISKRIPRNPKQAIKFRAPIDDVLDAELFKALGDPTRLALLACLSKCRRACSVSEVAECCSVDFSVVSRHLSILARAGVLEGSKQGRTVYYRVRYTDISKNLRSVAKAFEECCYNNGEVCCK